MSSTIPTQEELAEAARFETQARQDLQDIRQLRDDVPFNRYFLRRLLQRRDYIANRFKNEPATECDKEEREILRRVLIELETFINLASADEAEAKLSLGRLA